MRDNLPAPPLLSNLPNDHQHDASDGCGTYAKRIAAMPVTPIAPMPISFQRFTSSVTGFISAASAPIDVIDASTSPTRSTN